jgi:uncharacterized protein YkwD
MCRRITFHRSLCRLALVGALAAAITGCSVKTPAMFTSFADPAATAAPSPSLKREHATALGGEPTAVRGANATAGATRVARLDDRAPVGSFEKAPAGALAERDYSHTSLNAERARDIINQYRAEKGLKPLRLNAELTSAAKAHARDLAKWDRISHYGSDGSNPWDRVKRAGYKARVAAENVGTGQVTFEEVMRGWKDSPGHNKNLLMGDVEHIGVALVHDPKTEFKSFWTLVLGAQM